MIEAQLRNDFPPIDESENDSLIAIETGN